jgi:hypothetical protein
MKRFFKRRAEHRLVNGVENPKQIKIDHEKEEKRSLRKRNNFIVPTCFLFHST